MRRPLLDYERRGTELKPLPRDEKFMRVFLVILALLAALLAASYAGLAIT